MYRESIHYGSLIILHVILSNLDVGLSREHCILI